jgi:chemotaxis protein methyltransferase CheR
VGARDEFLNQQAARDYEFRAADFQRVRKLIYERAGISLNESKQNMVYSRLARRLRAVGIDSFAAYLDRLERDAAFQAAEAQQFINALTTNLTAFFREPHHFPVLAQFLRAHSARGALKLWCSAASTGEEPYSIAMTMIEALGESTSARLIATDIDTDVLDTAARGVYRGESAQGCGESRLRRFFLRGTGANAGAVRVRPAVAKLVEFVPLNLLDEQWPRIQQFAPQLDVIFCRNVMIYFDKATQRKVLGRFARLLRPGGLLVVGHSENFADCREHFELKGKTVYERVGGAS